MKRKHLVSIGCLLVLALYIGGGPYLTLYRIRQAAIDSDAEAFPELVDFPSVKDGVREQIKVGISARAADQLTGQSKNGFATLGVALGMTMASHMVDEMVDSTISPSGIARILEQNRERGQSGEAQGKGEKVTFWQILKRGTSRYHSASRFSFSLPIGDKESEVMRLILTRDGISWRLSRVELPMNEIFSRVQRPSASAGKRK